MRCRHGKKISFGLSVREIQNAIKEVEQYRGDLNRKTEELCRRLTAEGIIIANANIGSSGFGKYIHLGSEITPQQAGCKAVFYMENSSKIVSEWQALEGVKSAEVSPCLMLEFGAGMKAENPANIPGVGTGTFSGGTHGNEPGWYYMDLQGEWHYSSGTVPKMPMYFAGKELRDKVVAIARDVFK
ncbi:hypothetical protein V8Q34_14665 [Blautia sp. JLR.GB0024]|uniref:hypothetical protein n=1 Tax=Blautia sp. JLR.GB0024 TaxID=3123295 RepID=UPI003006012C